MSLNRTEWVLSSYTQGEIPKRYREEQLEYHTHFYGW